MAVIRGNELLWAEAFGMADLELDVRRRPHIASALAASPRLFTATLAAAACRARCGGSRRAHLELPAGSARAAPRHHAAPAAHASRRHPPLRGQGLDRPKRRVPSIIVCTLNNADSPRGLHQRSAGRQARRARVVQHLWLHACVSIVLESAAKTPFLDLSRARLRGRWRWQSSAETRPRAHSADGERLSPGRDRRAMHPRSRGSGPTFARTIPRTNGLAAGC